MEKPLLTPKEYIEKNIEASEAKTKTPLIKLFVLGMMAGAFIALGGQASSVAMHAIDNVGIARFVAGCVFPIGLMMIIFVGGELFTGDCLMSMALFKGKISLSQMVKVLSIVFVSNLIGAIFMTYLVYLSGQFSYSSYGLGAFAIKVALGKVNLSFIQAFISGILCNVFVCIAVFMALACKDAISKLFAIFFPIMAFVVSGFEHCVANMFYIPAGIFALNDASALVQLNLLYGITDVSTLTWMNFFINNLIPVTLGNIVGGALIVGGICYYVHIKN